MYLILIKAVLLLIVTTIGRINCQADSSLDLCAICECSPSAKVPISVVCNGTTRRALRLSGARMTRMQRTVNITLSNYLSIGFERNSFSQVYDLQRLVIRNSERVSLPSGVFTSLQKLIIENINDLLVTSKAFMGLRDVQDIIIRNSHISDIPQYAFYDIKGLQNFHISNCTIHKIRADAIKVTMDPKSPFSFTKSTIGLVENNSIDITAYDIRIEKSKFDNILPSGLKLTAENILNIDSCVFGVKNSTSTTILEGSNIYVNNNFFRMIDLGDYNIVNSTKTFQFENNIIKDITLSTMTQEMHDVEYTIKNNTIINCKCTADHRIESWWSNLNNYVGILKDNYCQSSCGISLRQFAFDHKDICDAYKNADGYFNSFAYCSNLVAETTTDSIFEEQTTLKITENIPNEMNHNVPDVTTSRMAKSDANIKLMETFKYICMLVIVKLVFIS